MRTKVACDGSTLLSLRPAGGAIVKSIVVVGASLAGLEAARALRAQGYDGRLDVIGDETHRPYDRTALSKDFLSGTAGIDDVLLEGDDDLAAGWILGSAAVALDTGARQVVLADGRRVPADGIVVATGARARLLPCGRGGTGVHVLRTVDDALALRAELRPGVRLVVVGGGFIGGEVASAARSRGCEVTIVEAMSTPFAGSLGTRMGALVSDLHSRSGVRVLGGVGVSELVVRGRVESVRLLDGSEYPADVVVVGVGAVPNVEWLAGSRVAVGDGVLCDERGRTSVPGVVAVGDCSSWYDVHRGGCHRSQHWTGAHEQPAVAVRSLLAGAGSPAASATGTPYFRSDQYDVRIEFAGHASGADSVEIEEGSPAGRDVLAVYRRAGRPVAVLGMNQERSFGRWRNQLGAEPVPA
jgi:NADPH-dependent 2,4-dienoyl-CoA reductase/sulfur reductase-like enzyme